MKPTSFNAGFVKNFARFKLTNSTVNQLISALYDGIGTELSAKCKELFLTGQHQALVDLDIDPNNYKGNPEGFKRDLQAVSLLSKCDFLNLGVDRKANAFVKWTAVESNCARINRRLNTDVGPGVTRVKAWSEKDILARYLSIWRKQIASTLGYLDWDYILEHSGWGPGSTASLTGNDVSKAKKYLTESGITKRLYDVLTHVDVPRLSIWDRAFPIWRPAFVLCDEAKMHFVPKTAKVDRTICAEPGINLYLQKGVGALIAKRLSRAYGYNFREEAADRNRIVAKDLSYATVDFSAASDSICTNLLKILLPEDWYRGLNLLRSHKVLNGGAVIPLSKFSSMGNGFTFELETVIFWSLARVLTESSKAVYCFGDDVLLPVECYRRFCRISKCVGFNANLTKSFADGPYRESCGAHFFTEDGVSTDVRPFYIKEFPNAIRDVYRIANQWRSCYAQDSTWASIVSFCPKAYRNPIPLYCGDGGFQVLGLIPDSFSKSKDTGRSLGNGHEGCYYRAWVWVASETTRDDRGVLLDRLANPSVERALGNQVSFRFLSCAEVKRCRYSGIFSEAEGFIPFS